jgi:prephenate dehydrogenase
MSKPIITIIGLGATGASLGLALQRSETNFEIVGHDKAPEILQQAKKLQAIQRGEWNLHRACDKAQMIILAVPFDQIAPLLGHIAEDLSPDCLLLLLSPLLTPALEAAARHCPNHRRVVAGNPVVAGSGTTAASAARFEECVFALASTAQTDPAALEVASGFVTRIGAQPLYVDAHEYDGIAAGVQQVPEVLAALIMSVNSNAAGWREAQRLAGHTFAQVTDMPATPLALAQTLRANRSAVLLKLAQVQRELDHWRTLIESDEPANTPNGKDSKDGKNRKGGEEDPLLAALDAAFDARIRWEIQVKHKRWDADPATPAASQPSSGFLRQMLFGGLAGRRSSSPSSEQSKDSPNTR